MIAHAVGAMAECKSGRIAYLVVRRAGAGIGEKLQAIGWDDIQAGRIFKTNITRDRLAGIPSIQPEDWPIDVPADAAIAS